MSADCSCLLYVVQQQPLGSIQWSVVASNLRETNYTVTSLSKGVRYAFRVLASTGKTSSKPSPSTDLVQLLDRGNKAERVFFRQSCSQKKKCPKVMFHTFRTISEESTHHPGKT